MPLVTAEKSMNSAFVRRAMIRASVVLPTPGGPQKIIDEMLSDSISRLSTLPGPRRCRCPTNSSSVCGLSRAASGWFASFSLEKKLCCMVTSETAVSVDGGAMWTGEFTPPPLSR